MGSAFHWDVIPSDGMWIETRHFATRALATFLVSARLPAAIEPGGYSARLPASRTASRSSTRSAHRAPSLACDFCAK